MKKTIHSDDAMQMLLAQMQVMGIDPAEFAEFAERAPTSDEAVTMGAFITGTVMPALKKGQKTAYKSYAKLVINGYPKLCSCFCSRCLSAFKGDSQWSPCACVVAGVCGCSTADLAKGEASTDSCLVHCEGQGDRRFGLVRLSDWEHLARWAQLRARKRVEVRNRNRSEVGDPTFKHDGRSAAELLRAFGNEVNRLAAGSNIPGAQRHMLEDMTVKPRPDIVARSYTIEHVEELWRAIFTSGSDDAELDMILIWIILETGARRGGPIGGTIGDLLFTAGKIRLAEKNGKVDEQPTSRELLQVLLSHALQRGNILISKPNGLELADITIDHVTAGVVRLRTAEPILYYKSWWPKKHEVLGPDGTTKSVPVVDEHGSPILIPHDVGRKRYETLWKRLKAELPWLKEIHGRPHDLRKTMGTFVERAYGHAVAQAWLRHKVVGTTETYTAATAQDVRDAHTWLVGGRDREDG